MIIRSKSVHLRPTKPSAGAPPRLTASAGADNSIKIWNLTDGEVLRTLAGHSGWVYSLAVLQN